MDVENPSLPIDVLFEAIKDSDLRSLLRLRLLDVNLMHLIDSYLPIEIQCPDYTKITERTISVCRESVIAYRNGGGKLNSIQLLLILFKICKQLSCKIEGIEVIEQCDVASDSEAIFYRTAPSLQLINVCGEDSSINRQYILQSSDETDTHNTGNYTFTASTVIYSKEKGRICWMQPNSAYAKLYDVYNDCKLMNIYRLPVRKNCRPFINLFVEKNGRITYSKESGLVGINYHGIYAIRTTNEEFTDMRLALNCLIQKLCENSELPSENKKFVFIYINSKTNKIQAVHANVTLQGTFTKNRLLRSVGARIYEFCEGFPKEFRPSDADADYTGLTDAMRSVVIKYNAMIPWRSFEWNKNKRIYAHQAMNAAQKLYNIANLILKKDDQQKMLGQ